MRANDRTKEQMAQYSAIYALLSLPGELTGVLLRTIWLQREAKRPTRFFGSTGSESLMLSLLVIISLFGAFLFCEMCNSMITGKCIWRVDEGMIYDPWGIPHDF